MERVGIKEIILAGLVTAGSWGISDISPSSIVSVHYPQTRNLVNGKYVTKSFDQYCWYHRGRLGQEEQAVCNSDQIDVLLKYLPEEIKRFKKS